MVRRLKLDVLTELPAKRRQIIELSKSDYAGILRRENAAVDAHENRLVELRARVELSSFSDDPADYERAALELEQVETVAFNELSRIRHLKPAVAKIPQWFTYTSGKFLKPGKRSWFLRTTWTWLTES